MPDSSQPKQPNARDEAHLLICPHCGQIYDHSKVEEKDWHSQADGHAPNFKEDKRP